MRHIMGFLLAAICLAGVYSQALAGGPTNKDKCPVCGMFVYKYPDWIASTTMKDGTVYYYDGAKDMFRHCLESLDRAQVASMSVTEYYDLKPVDATKAWYVIGSDVYGPMGHELVPLASRAAAEEFMSDHRGRDVLGFEDVDLKVLGGLR